MALLAFALAGLLVGLASAAALQASRGAKPPEDTATRILDWGSGGLLLAVATWVATSWLLALAHLLRPGALIAASVLAIAAGVLLLARQRNLRSTTYAIEDRAAALAAIVALLPVAAWLLFVAWRGTILPVYNHDGLAYHMPKAVLLMKEKGFTRFDVPEPRIATWPWNYELLLADTMILGGSDHFAALPGTFGYVLLLLLSARTASGWWRGGAHVAFVVAAVATAPIVILHSGLHKNDLLFCAFATATLVWGARWYATGCRASLVLATTGLLLAIGTKVTGAFLLLAVLPLVVLRMRRHGLHLPERLRFVGIASAASLLLGSVPYFVNLAVYHRAFLAADMTGGQGYGDWSNIWMYTCMVLLSPFGGPQFVWNPFRGEKWWWPQNDVWMSNFGVLVSVLVLLLVPCLLRYRKQGDAVQRAERVAAGSSALVAYALALPVHVHPVGMFAGSSRYVMFVLPIVASFTISPVVLELERRTGRWRPWVLFALGAAAAAAVVPPVLRFGVHDAYAPIEYVEYMLAHPDNRVPFVRRNRAATVFDQVAGPHATCAFDVGFDTWIYPAYGAGWTRKVEFLRPGEPTVAIPDDADWVVIDRSWNVFFGHPGFTDTGKALQFLGRGKPSEADLRVYRQLRADPRFELVYDDRNQNQALFRRRHTDTAGARPAP